MWQAVKISDETYFFQCLVEESKVKYFLYNLKEVWSEECTLANVLQRAKELNKRISYPSEVIMETLQSGIPTTSQLQESEGISHTLLLKFHISGRPFNFHWELRPLPQDEFQKLVTIPLFASIYYYAEQIKELKDAIKKKDLEIEQYKAEGAVLRRTTIATIPFDEDGFENRYKMVNNMSKGLLGISREIKPSLPKIDIHKAATEIKAKPVVPMEKLIKSPIKLKRRKFFENLRIRRESAHRAKLETTEFESSQSQTPPMDVVEDATSSEVAEIFQSLDELNAKRMRDTMRNPCV